MTTTVRAVSDISVPVASLTNGHADRGVQNNSPGSRMFYSRAIGALFLSAFLFYGGGSALVTSVLGGPDFLSTISAHQTTLAIGVFLMLLNSVAVVSLGVLFFPIVERHSKRIALAYLAARIVEGVMLAIGALSVLMIGPFGQRVVDAGEAARHGPMSSGRSQSRPTRRPTRSPRCRSDSGACSCVRCCSGPG